MKWKYFWIGLIFFLGSFRVYRIDRLVNNSVNSLTRLSFFIMILSGLFILYFILEESGIIDYLRENLE